MLESEHTFAFARLQDLQNNPVKGAFDLEHLCEIHRRTFQDVSSYRGGELRVDGSWNKKRILEGHSFGYTVHYSPSYRSKLSAAFEPFQDLNFWKSLSKSDFSKYLAYVYSELDYLHPFTEGNSRALREFTQQFAKHTGHNFRWTPGSNSQTAFDRNKLYMARDINVLKKHYPTLQPEAALAKYSNGYDCEEFISSKKKYLQDLSLNDIIFNNISLCEESIVSLSSPSISPLNNTPYRSKRFS